MGTTRPRVLSLLWERRLNLHREVKHLSRGDTAQEVSGKVATPCGNNSMASISFLPTLRLASCCCCCVKWQSLHCDQLLLLDGAGEDGWEVPQGWGS